MPFDFNLFWCFEFCWCTTVTECNGITFFTRNLVTTALVSCSFSVVFVFQFRQYNTIAESAARHSTSINIVVCCLRCFCCHFFLVVCCPNFFLLTTTGSVAVELGHECVSLEAVWVYMGTTWTRSLSYRNIIWVSIVLFQRSSVQCLCVCLLFSHLVFSHVLIFPSPPLWLYFQSHKELVINAMWHFRLCTL